MWAGVANLLAIGAGLWCLLTRKQAARDSAEFQQHMFPKMRAHDARTLQRTEIVFAIVGVAFMLFGTLGLIGMLPLER